MRNPLVAECCLLWLSTRTVISAPGEGFFELAEALGYEVVDYDVFWIEMLNNVYSYWQKEP